MDSDKTDKIGMFLLDETKCPSKYEVNLDSGGFDWDDESLFEFGEKSLPKLTQGCESIGIDTGK